MSDQKPERTPLSSQDILRMQEEDAARRQRRDTHPTKGTARPTTYVSPEQYDRELRARKREKDQIVGNEPSRLPDISVMQGQRPQRPEKIPIGDEKNK